MGVTATADADSREMGFFLEWKCPTMILAIVWGSDVGEDSGFVVLVSLADVSWDHWLVFIPWIEWALRLKVSRWCYGDASDAAWGGQTVRTPCYKRNTRTVCSQCVCESDVAARLTARTATRSLPMYTEMDAHLVTTHDNQHHLAPAAEFHLFKFLQRYLL